MLSCTMVDLLKDSIVIENADREKCSKCLSASCKVLKASRLRRGEVRLCANEDIMFMQDHTKRQ